MLINALQILRWLLLLVSHAILVAFLPILIHVGQRVLTLVALRVAR